MVTLKCSRWKNRKRQKSALQNRNVVFKFRLKNLFPFIADHFLNLSWSFASSIILITFKSSFTESIDLFWFSPLPFIGYVHFVYSSTNVVVFSPVDVNLTSLNLSFILSTCAIFCIYFLFYLF